MHTPQAGIFEEGSAYHYYLEWRVRDGVEDARLREALATACRAMDPRADSRGQHLVVAFGEACLRRLRPDAVPAKLQPFETVVGAAGERAPATQNDIFFWVHGSRLDENLARALDIGRALEPVARLVVDLPGFVFRDSRDLIGFIDGSANPKDEQRPVAALIPEGEVGEAGAYVMTQRWVHDLVAWERLSIAEQEKIVGRTKPDSVEFEGDAMPEDSHVSRTDVSEDGVALKIYRRSAPYGTVSEHGLFFLCFACDLHRIKVMLDRMYGNTGDGLHDRIIEFTRAVTGSFWFAPSVEELRSVVG